MPALLFLGILHAGSVIALQPQMLGYFTRATLVSFFAGFGVVDGAAHEQIASKERPAPICAPNSAWCCRTLGSIRTRLQEISVSENCATFEEVVDGDYS